MTGALSLLCGVLLGLLSADTPNARWMCGAGPLVIAWMASPLRHDERATSLACVLLGLFASSVVALEWRQALLPVQGAETRLLIEGRVSGVPAREGGVLHFDLETLRVEGAGLRDTHPRRVRVSWREPPAEPRAGEQWRLLIRVLPLAGARNFEGRDAARFAFREGVHANGRVLPSPLNELLRLAPAGVDTLRARIASRIRDHIADPDAAALVTALAVGLTAGMSRDQWRVFNATGTTHLVAISGLHVTLFAWLAFRVARFAWRFIPARIDREPFAGIAGLAAAGGYSLLAGFSVPTQRTWIMLATFVFARLVARRVGAGRFWSVALTLVLLLDPRAPLAAGFWLSFIAVGVLLWMAAPEMVVMPLRRWGLALKSQFAITLALAPTCIAVFGGVSVAGLAANLVAIPLISLVFVPLVLAGAVTAWLAPPWDALFFAMAASAHAACWPWLVAAADLPLASWRVAPEAWWFVLSMAAVSIWMCRGPGVIRATALCALLPLAWPRSTAPAEGAVRMSVLDAGRGTAVLVRTASQALLFDTGDTWSTRGSRVRDIVLPALDARGVSSVDTVVLPRLDEDRAHGVALLALERGAGEVITQAGWPGTGLDVRRCRDRAWRRDGVEFRAFGTGRACLLRIDNGRVSALLAWDFDDAEVAEDDDVIVMARASVTVASTWWIGNGSPGFAVIAGGVPHSRIRSEALETWGRRARRVLDAHEVGAIEFEMDEGVRLVATARESRFPFLWRRVPI